MIGLLGMGTSLLGSAWGSFMSARANNRARAALTDEHNRQQQWYDAKLAEDYTQRADVQSVMTNQRKMLSDAYRRARATNAVAGGSDESLAAMQSGANDSLAGTMSNIAAQSSNYKSGIEQSKMAEGQSYANQMAGISQQQGQQAIAQGQSIAQAGGNMIKAETDWSWLKPKKKKA